LHNRIQGKEVVEKLLQAKLACIKKPRRQNLLGFFIGATKPPK
jgi:hypothetical protein